MHRTLKQILYGALYLGIFSGVAYLVVRLSLPAPPPPQPELKPLVVVRSVYFIHQEEGTVDLGAEVRNPNASWGVKEFRYEFVLKDAGGKELGRIAGTSFILPGETRWIVLPGGTANSPAAIRLPRNGTLAAVTFEIKPIGADAWQKVRPFAAEASLATKNLRFQNLTLSGEVENRSSFTLDRVEVVGLLFDASGSLVAIGRTVVKTVTPAESRAFFVRWPSRPANVVLRTAAYAYTNFLLDETFIRQFGE
jgi:hypothetical protein